MGVPSFARLILVVLVTWSAQGICLAAPPEPKRGDQPAPQPRPAPPEPVLVRSILDDSVHPIDLGSALQLAGVQNPEILLANERIMEADAIRQLAAVELLPSINVGANFDLHRGTYQQANGNIIKVNRDSLYGGLGSAVVGAGTVNIPGLVVSANLGQAIYDPLVARQLVRQREFSSLAVRNAVLFRVASAYLDLLRGEGHRAVVLKTRDEAREVARLTGNYARTGQGRQADADRAATELDQRNTELLEADSDVLTASARLTELLGLDPAVRLHAVDGWVVPSPIVPEPTPLTELLVIALTQRPELAARQAEIRAALLRLRQARLLPLSPNILAGFSAGTFGGGSNLAANGIQQPDGTVLRQPRFDSFDGRTDSDAVVYWSLQNLGVGNVALTRLAQSNLRRTNYAQLQVLNQVRAEVAAAHARVHARFAQIATAERAVRSSQEAFREDLARTKNPPWLPIEVLDSLRLLGRSRTAYLEAIIEYNRAQFELYVALGQPPADSLARAIPESLVPAPTPKLPGPSK